MSACTPSSPKTNSCFFSYSARYGGGVGTRIAKARLVGSRLTQLQELFSALPLGSGGRHFGSRILFGPPSAGGGSSDLLFFGVGDRGDRHKAQKLNFPNGKLFRIKQDGSIPPDNPFVKTEGALPAIWSLGHRNPQGMAWDASGHLWEQEHGPRGGDEINRIAKGKNYGWPVITYGREYWGPKIGDTHRKGMEQPVKHFTPSIAPSSLMIYSGKLFKKWKGDFFSASLKFTHINRLVITQGKVAKEERFLQRSLGERVRHIREAPSGEIFFSTDRGHLYILRLAPEEVAPSPAPTARPSLGQ